MTNVNDAKFKAACEEYIREALADGLNREQVFARLEEMAKIALASRSPKLALRSKFSLVENQTRNIDSSRGLFFSVAVYFGEMNGVG